MSELTPKYVLRVSEPSVVVPARVAAFLEQRAHLSALRVSVRGIDPEVSEVLESLRYVAMAWRGSAAGTEVEAGPEPATDSKQWMTTGGAAGVLGITSRAVRKAIARGAIPAEEVDGRYRVNREDIEHYRAARAA